MLFPELPLTTKPALRRLTLHIAAFSQTTFFRSTSEVMNEPSLLLQDGNKIPMLAFGTGTAWFKEPEDAGRFDPDLVEMTKKALAAGFRHIDCAEMYNNEEEVGVALNQSGITRKEVFITTKVADGINDIPAALDASLKKLQLDYVDLYLIHEPWNLHSKADFQKAWRAMENIKKMGKAKSIGVANFVRQNMENILDGANEKPVINQLEYHPYIQRRNDGDLYIPWMQKNGIAVEAFKSLSPAIRWPEGPLMATLTDLAKKYKTTEAVIILRWCLQQSVIVITTTRKDERMREYASALKMELTGDEIEEITKVGGTVFRRWYMPERYAEGDLS